MGAHVETVRGGAKHLLEQHDQALSLADIRANVSRKEAPADRQRLPLDPEQAGHTAKLATHSRNPKTQIEA